MTALTQAQVDAVVAGKRAELEACLAHLPANPHKKAAEIVLSLEIDDSGEVQTATVTNVTDEVERCIAVAAAEWDFPSTDVKADAATFKCQLVGARPTVATRDAKSAKPAQKPAAH
ncbi:MAG TPA: AgmX/PglI C-terminal domain-containing protein [Kofleriaceae bacterium]|nr:AgmX/PglI C-terminal domain-containing protein [Kofleriaceae bacterium]